MLRAVRAVVRKRGSIGIFMPQWFDVEAPEEATAEDLERAWFRRYDQEYELNRFVRAK